MSDEPMSPGGTQPIMEIVTPEAPPQVAESAAADVAAADVDRSDVGAEGDGTEVALPEPGSAAIDHFAPGTIEPEPSEEEST
jgi:hypothetical protein